MQTCSQELSWGTASSTLSHPVHIMKFPQHPHIVRFYGYFNDKDLTDRLDLCNVSNGFVAGREVRLRMFRNFFSESVILHDNKILRGA